MENLNSRTRKALGTTAGFVFLLLAMGGAGTPSAVAQGPAANPEPRAEEVFSNVQVLRGLPYGQMLPSMYLFADSLGVECGYCHAPSGMRHLDVKATKQTAREMIRMVRALNKDAFGGRNVVTCYTCHRGSPQPAVTPVLADREPNAEPVGGTEVGKRSPGAMPTAVQLLDRYVAAVGGEAAIRKISTRVEQGTVTEVQSGRMAQHPVEIFARAPDKRFTKGFSMQHIGNSPEAFGGYNGDVGWLQESSGPPVLAWSARLDAARLEDTLNFPLRVKQFLSQLRMEGSEKVGNQETYVVSGQFTQALPLVKLYFAQDSGLLARLVYYTQTAVGLYPTRIDYSDYRAVDGLKVPFRWTVDMVRKRHLTYQMDDVQQNTPLEDATFALPIPLPSYR